MQNIDAAPKQNQKKRDKKIKSKKAKNLQLKSGGAIIDQANGAGKALIVNFKYKKNKILEELTKNDQEKEIGIIL